MRGRRPTWATVDLGALAGNLAELRRRAAGRSVIAVVKADAYGHGAPAVARALLAAGAERLAVLTVEEAAELRESGLAAPILVLAGVHDPEEAATAAALRVAPVIHEERAVAWLAAAARARREALDVQVEVDTGMRRMGVAPERALEVLAAVRDEPGLRLEGLFTHLACADDRDPAPTREQLERFEALRLAARAAGIVPPHVHVANSAALLAAASWGDDVLVGDAVRPGIALYGVSPAPHLETKSLRPVMTLRARVVHVRELAPGEAVGYGGTWRAPTRRRVATLPVGYADGLPWSLANRGEVWLRGRRRPVAGRVSMDYVTVDLGGDPAEVGDEAVLFGRGEGGGIPVEDVAEAAGTLAYELLVRVGRRVPRVVLEP